MAAVNPTSLDEYLARFPSQMAAWEVIRQIPEISIGPDIDHTTAQLAVRSLTIIADIFPVANMERPTLRPEWRIYLHPLEDVKFTVELVPIINPQYPWVVSFRATKKNPDFRPRPDSVELRTLDLVSIEPAKSPHGRYPTLGDIIRMLLSKGMHRFPKQSEPYHDNFPWCDHFISALAEDGWMDEHVPYFPGLLKESIASYFKVDIFQEDI
ncbi:hypothetical protein CALCODRAFT_510175 [Calocera cornea HHB12733]|uniref:Uncharacterized protein n=1 Tax=Calocera cornea HHB12733 TaxID=1353952 RepID=A0A165ERL2_9BASI|nr:hypothetical protein CALCODRAFT_510175 [Calocera cornea HHB12733]